MARRRAAKTALDVTTQQLDTLSLEELREVHNMLDILIASKSESANLNQRKATDPDIHQGPKGGRGHIEIKLIPDTKRGKTYGPYRYLRYWQEGKLKTRYLGKENT